MWQPIETAPKDNKRPLWLTRFNDDDTTQSFDYNGTWESESESYVPRGLADDDGDGPSYTNYGIRITW